MRWTQNDIKSHIPRPGRTHFSWTPFQLTNRHARTRTQAYTCINTGFSLKQCYGGSFIPQQNKAKLLIYTIQCLRKPFRPLLLFPHFVMLQPCSKTDKIKHFPQQSTHNTPSLMFPQLDWSTPVVNSIDWTWFRRAHTCLYKAPQLTVHVRAKTKLWGQIVHRALRQDCVEAQIWGEKMSTALKAPKNTVASIILKWN
jgi:hypothetical protein